MKHHKLVLLNSHSDGSADAICSMCGEQIRLSEWPPSQPIECAAMARIAQRQSAHQSTQPRPIDGAVVLRTITAWARAKRQAITMKSEFGKRVEKYLAARKRWDDAGRPIVAPDILSARMDACATCSHRIPGIPIGTCGLCGCNLRDKQEWATERCPDKRWGESKNENCNCGG